MDGFVEACEMLVDLWVYFQKGRTHEDGPSY